MSADTRLKLGISLLILGLVMPVGALFVVGTDWSADVKAVVSGALLFGPELTMVGAVALMGKENFDRIVAQVKGGLKTLKPAVNVSRQRHAIGLALFVGSMVSAWMVSYIPYLMPEEYFLRVSLNLGLDLIFGISLFVLGGDFWDKLRALFLRETRAVL
jgi:hypothetical protein